MAAFTRIIAERRAYEEAVAAVEAVLSEPEIGHAGDISEGGERTLFWASEALAANDDGARAAGSISVECCS